MIGPETQKVEIAIEKAQRPIDALEKLGFANRPATRCEVGTVVPSFTCLDCSLVLNGFSCESPLENYPTKITATKMTAKTKSQCQYWVGCRGTRMICLP